MTKKEWQQRLLIKKEERKKIIDNIINLNKMYRKQQINRNNIIAKESVVGQSIEDKIAEMKNNQEGITTEVPLIYTEKKEGIVPAYDIRTDAREIQTINLSRGANRYREAATKKWQQPETEAGKKDENEKNAGGKSDKPESTQATE